MKPPAAHWKEALGKFLAPWQRRREVIGALVTGSQVTGTATPASDVDVHIVLADNVRWRERGNRIVDGWLFEYFANPVRQLRAYLDADDRDGRRHTARMFATGRIVFDRTGAVRRFQRIAARRLRRPLRRPGRAWREAAKYSLWDLLDGVTDDPGFAFHYHAALGHALETYAKFLGAEVPSSSAKLWPALMSREFRSRYRLPPFPDGTFVRLFLRCLRAAGRPARVAALSALTAHVHRRMGGFRIDGWKLRTRLVLR